MDISTITRPLAALAQDTRLEIYRALLEYGKTGLPAGRIGARLGIPHNTLSFHLTHLKMAGLVRCTRQGRQRIYVADPGAVERLIGYLSDTCCIHDENAEDCALDGPSANGGRQICGERT